MYTLRICDNVETIVNYTVQNYDEKQMFPVDER